MFSQFKYVKAVAEMGSFSDAAKSLYITQPCLSAMIKKAETQLGITLFDRSSKPLTLTEFGRQYLNYYERISSIEREFESYLNDMRGLQTGSLTIGTNNVFASYILPPLIRHFNSHYPGVRVQMIEGNVKYLAEALAAGNLDFIIDNCPLDASEFSQEQVGEEHLLLSVHRDISDDEETKRAALTYQQIISGLHLSENIPCVSIDQFAHLPFILLRAGNDTRFRTDNIFQSSSISIIEQLEVDQLATAYNISCNRLGVTLVSDTLIRNATPNDDMEYYKLNSPYIRRPIYIYSKRKKYQTAAMQTFLSVARTYVSNEALRSSR